MRWIARHRKILNVCISVVLIVVFVYFARQTINHKDVDVDSQVYSGTAMGTAIKKTLYAEDVAECDRVDVWIDDMLHQLENQISVRYSDSEISKLNRSYATGGVYRLSDNVLEYLEEELQIYKETEGAFSPCIRPITSLWAIEDGNAVIPGDDQIEEMLSRCNGDAIEITEGGVILHSADMALDLGATGKGIACDEIREQLKETEIVGAVISVGGSILAYGNKGDGKEWHIGIRDPRGEEGDVLGVLDVAGDVVVSTSGDYEKYFEQNGKRYHHIFNPYTGYPTDNGLISVTIVCENGLRSDALSTACFVMGLEKGMTYAQEQGIDAVFVTEEKQVYVTKNLKKKFRLQAEGYELVK